MTLDELHAAVQRLRALPPAVVRFDLSRSTLSMTRKACIPHLRGGPTVVGSSFMGVPIYVDDELGHGVIRAHYGDGSERLIDGSSEEE